MCWSSRFWPGRGHTRTRGAKGRLGSEGTGLRGTKGRLGSEGRDRRWVGWGVILLYLSWKQSPLYSFTNWGRNPILFLPVCADPAPSPVPCRQVPAALGPQRGRASLYANPSWVEVGTLRCPRAPALEAHAEELGVPGAPSGESPASPSAGSGLWELRGGGWSWRWSRPQAAPNTLLQTHQCLPLFCAHPAAPVCQLAPSRERNAAGILCQTRLCWEE